MTNDVATNALMESSDVKATVLAAIARIESVPAGTTLIDEISDQDWLDDTVADWKIEAGNANNSEELDFVDKEIVRVA